LIEVLPNRKKSTVLAFLKKIPDELQTTIEDVATDMYEGYLKGVSHLLHEKKF
jgi:transposase